MPPAQNKNWQLLDIWLSTYPMFNTEKEKDNDTIKQVLHNNKYDTAILNKVNWTKNEKEQKKNHKQDA